ncbi:DUF6544 family protein [Massilia sp. BSC265]|uniref:DUF6544 family protein n=1 Tax=Massilia sp. BSC265 TaxID=1549812 RepID=UPI00190FA34F|nr:DUF6544 family protein [Massilia sp. BSC265]
MRQKMLLISLAALSVLVLIALLMLAWRMSEARTMASAWKQLQGPASASTELFSRQMVKDLPDAARRYFLFTIAEGTALRQVSEIRMSGEICLGSKADPACRPMQASQILASPHGFIWSVEAGTGIMHIVGSDGMLADRSWTRFWLGGILPVVRAGGDSNHLRASFGRVVAEAAFWAPASLLPGKGVDWVEGNTPNQARAIVRRGSLTQTLDIDIADDGRPLRVLIPRWSNVNPEKEWRLQPFGGTLAEFRSFGGFTLPTRVDGGNHMGTADYFPFFRARVESITFP